jgi:eukaryotic-like serine/threonine-protein kinase
VNLATPASSPLVPGYRLDRYELICPIAMGGMATVWVARMQGKHGFERLVAVKSILAGYAADPTFQRMFLDEARIATRIEHTNVARILDLGEQSDVVYLVMEYVDGDALSRLHRVMVKKGQLIPPGIVLRVVADACGGLHAAHELRDKDGHPLGVVHRDVSPQNILVTSQGVAKLIDFGIAKAKNRVAGETSSGTLKGKVHYMAPEQALGRPVDRRADIWAVGSMLYHLLTGKLAYAGDNELHTLHILTSDKPLPPLPDTVPEPVAAIIKRAMSRSPEDRFATAAEMQDALERAIVQAALTTPTSTVSWFVKEHLSERVRSRQEALQLGLAAASDRERIAELLSPKADSSESISDAQKKIDAVELPHSSPSLATSPTGPTLSSTTMEAAVARRPARSFAIAVSGAVVGAILAASVAVALVRRGTPLANASSAPPESAHSGAVSLSPVHSPTPPAASASVDPKASAASSSAPSVAPSRPPRAAPAKPAAAPRRPRINDGF